MAGLLDAYTFLGNDLALSMVKAEAEYFMRYYDNVIAVNGTEHWLLMLETEFGGMNEVLFNLYDITGDPEHFRCHLLPPLHLTSQSRSHVLQYSPDKTCIT